MSEKNETTPESTTGDKDEQLEKIESLSTSISSDFTAIRIVGLLVIVSALANLYIAATVELTSPLMLPVLFASLLGNHLYGIRTRKKQVKLAEMKKAYESKFGVIVPSANTTS